MKLAQPFTLITALLILSLATPALAEDHIIKTSFPQPEFAPLCVPTWYARQGGTPYSLQQEHITIAPLQLAPTQAPVTVHTGDVAMGDCAGLSVIAQAWSKGANDLVILSFGAVKPLYVLIGSKKIKTLADFKGGKLAAPGIQSTAGEAIAEILKRGAGLLPDRDYTFVSAGTAPARVAALTVGTIDGTSSLAPLSYRLVDQGFPLVADEMTYVPRYAIGALFTTRGWIEKNHDTVIALLKTVVQTGEWLGDPANKSAVIHLLATTEYLAHTPMGQDYAERFYADMFDAKRVALDGYADEATIRANIGIMLDQGFLKKENVPPLDKLVDYSFMNEARQQLGMPPVKLISP